MKTKGTQVTPIGRLDGTGAEPRVLGPDGSDLELARKGYAHF